MKPRNKYSTPQAIKNLVWPNIDVCIKFNVCLCLFTMHDRTTGWIKTKFGTEVSFYPGKVIW